MTEIHDLLYPPKEQDARVSHRRYDSKERLVAWSVRQDDHFLLFRVDAFRDVTLANGDKLDVAETIRCRFSAQDIDPNAAFADECTVSYDAYGNIETGTELYPSLGGLYTWAGREPDGETQLQHNNARFYDPTPGRWISEDLLRYDACEANLYPYIDPAKLPADPREEGE